jgi:hypothetical protein
MKYLIIQTLIVALLFISDTSNEKKVYKVKKTQNDIIVTGYGSDDAWKNANILTEFLYPWQPEDIPYTEFKSLWSDTHFYFLFTVEDHEIITPQRGLGERDAVASDRVEVFFKAKDDKDPYYSLEMDALGRCLDTDGRFGGKVDFDWDWPKDQFVLKASQHKGGYIVEGSITLESLRQLGIYHDDGVLEAGLYRGDYFLKENDEIGIKWISWVVASAEKPIFHIPTSFGILKLLD